MPGWKGNPAGGSSIDGRLGGASKGRLRIALGRIGPDAVAVISFPPPSPPRGGPLTAAERAIAAAVARGRSNAEIARSRCRATRTVANQVASVLRKLRVGSRGELVAALGRDGAAENLEAPSSLGRPVRPDLLGVVECAYDLRGSEMEWLRRVAERVRPFFDHGLGMMAGTFSLPRPGAFRLGRTAFSNVPPEVARATRRLHGRMNDRRDASAQDWQRAYRAGTGLTSIRRSIDLERTDSTARAVGALLGSVGARDFYAVIFTDPTGCGAIVSLARRNEDGPSRAEMATWARVAAHLAAGFRLVRSLGASEAVLHPGGRVVHAEGPAAGADAREALRRAAIAIDRSRGPLRCRDRDGALAIWRGLVDGRWSLVDRFDRDGRRFLVAHRNDPRVRDPRALTLRERQVLGYVALGQANKLVAYTLGIAESSVATHLSSAMGKLGLRSRVDLVAWLGRLAAAGEPSASPTK